MLGTIIIFLIVLLPTIIISLIFLAPAAFFVVKYKNTKKPIFLVFLAVIIAAFSFLSFVMIAPSKGRVLDALTGEPISGIQVVRVVKATPIILNPAGGPESQIYRYDNSKTDTKGSYSLPFKISRLSSSKALPFFPVYGLIDKVYVSVPLCDGVLTCSILDYALFRSSDIGAVPPEGKVGYENQKYEEKYNYETFSFNNGRVAIANEDNGEIFNQGKIVLFSRKRDFYLIPKVDRLETCDNLAIKELANFCKEINASRLAVLTGNEKICKYASDQVRLFSRKHKFDCIDETAKAAWDEKKCLEFITLSEKYLENKNRCMRIVATAKGDAQLCRTIINSKWLEAQGANPSFCQSYGGQ